MIGLVRSSMTAIWQAITSPFSQRSRWSALESMLAGQMTTASGAEVTAETALAATGVYACVRIIAETIASLPLGVYRYKDERARELDRKHPLFKILHSRPNPAMTSFTFRETMIAHLVLRGNAYAKIKRNGGGDVIALWPLHPDYVTPVFVGETLQYRVRENGQDAMYPASQILHLRGMGADGVQGYSVITLAREAVGLAMSCEESGARLFGNGSTPGGILVSPGKLSPDRKRDIAATWQAAYGGNANRYRVAVLDGGELNWQPVGMPPEDAQFLQTRTFQLAEMARWFNIPLHKLQVLENASYATVEQQNIDFVVHCIRPWCERLEQELCSQLLSEKDQETHFAKHRIDGLLRGDLASRYTAYATARQWGWMSVNDILELEDRNPVGPEGDVYLSPMNMTPASSYVDNGDPSTNEVDPVVASQVGAASVQDTALNGAQITSVLELVSAVATGAVPAESAIEMLLIAFPTVDRGEAEKLINPAADLAASRPAADPTPKDQPKLLPAVSAT